MRTRDEEMKMNLIVLGSARVKADLPFAPRSSGIMKPRGSRNWSRVCSTHPAWQVSTPDTSSKLKMIKLIVLV